jgi:hypothetical protein
VETSKSLLSFESEKALASPRYLTLRDRRAFEIGNLCNTCSFWFERLEGANDKVDVGALADRLAVGLTSLEDEVTSALLKLVPVSEYRVALLRISPRLVVPGDESDYFCHEQLENDGIDGFWGLPHSPRVTYYRPAARWDVSMGSSDGHAFDFVVPMFPENWLNRARLEFYHAALANGIAPTAVSLSLLDVKRPAMEGEDHWCMAHYLIDGHHKVASAAATGMPITLLSFIALDHGISNAEEVDRFLATY